MAEASGKSQEYLQMKEVDDEISKIERKLAHVSKFIAHKYQKDGRKIDADETEIDEADFEKGLLDYFKVSEDFERKKTKQLKTNEDLQKELKKVMQKHETAREDLKRILLGILSSFNLKKISGGRKSRRTSAVEEIQNKELNEMFEKQKSMEDKVLKLRQKMYINVQETQYEQESKEAMFRREMRILQQQLQGEILKRKLSVAQNLLSKQITLKNQLMDERNEGDMRKRTFNNEVATLKSDHYMSDLALKQVYQRYKKLQLEHQDLWLKVDEAKIDGDLAILASMDKQHSILLNDLDEDIRSERIKCEELDQLLSKFMGKTKMLPEQL